MDFANMSDEELQRIAGGHAEPKGALDYSAMSDDELERIANQKPQKKESTQSDAALQGFGSGLTFGYAPHLQAAAEKPLAKAYDWIMGTNVSDDIDDDYVKRRDAWIKRERKLAEENPGTFGTASVAGSVVSGLAIPGGALTSGGGRVASAASTAAKLGAAGGRAARAGVQGAALAAIANPGDTEGEISGLQLGDRAANAWDGLKFGALASGGAEALGKGAQFMAGKFKNAAEEKAFKSLGPYARDAMKAHERGQIRETGRVLLDEGVVRGLPTSHENLAKRASDALEAKGTKMQAYLEKLDDAAKSLDGGEPGLIPAGAPIPKTSAGVNRAAIAKSLREDLVNPNLDIPGVRAKNARVEALIKQFEAGDDQLIPILKAEQLKRSVGKEIKWDRLPGADIPLQEEVNRGLYSKLRKGVEDAAEFMDNKLHGEGAGQFKQLKNEYGALDRASEIANRRDAKEMANRFMSPTDYAVTGMGVGGGFASGDTPEEKLRNAMIGLGAGLAHRGVRKYGNQAVAATYDTISKTLAKGPAAAQALVGKPMAFQAGAQAYGRGSEQPFVSGELLDRAESDPGVIDMISNPRLREALKKAVEKRRAKDASEGAQYTPDGHVDGDEARQKFLAGN